MISTNLLSGEGGGRRINSFTYNASSIPDGTGLIVQFSRDNTTWYNSEAVQYGWDTLSQGSHTIDLTGLYWVNTSKFYYRVLFSSDGTDTPLLDSVQVDFDTVVGQYDTYNTSGTLVSTNLLAGELVYSIESFNYNASVIPADTTLTAQFSQDNATWYNAAGVQDGSDSLVDGSNTIDISGLGWSGSDFYYRINFTSDGIRTPKLDSVSLSFTEAKIVSGTVYSDKGSAPLTSKQVRLAVNGIDVATATSDASDGTYKISVLSDTFSDEDVLTVYLEDETADGVTVTVAGGSNMAGIDLYQNYLIARHDNSGSLTNSNLATAIVAGENDISNIYSVSSDNLVLENGKELYVAASNTFAPGGGVSANNIDVRGTLSLVGDESLSYTDISNSGTVVYTGTSTYSGGLIAGDTYNNLIFNGSSGEWDLDNALDINGNLTLTDGILDMNGHDLTVAGNVARSSGVFSNTAGRTITLDGNTQEVNMGGSVWSTISITSGSGNVTISGNVTASSELTIASGDTLNVATGVSVTASGNITNNGTITETGTGKIIHASTSLYIADENFDIDDVISLGHDKIYISLTDEDGNLNGQAADSLAGVVIACATDSETITLTETGNATEVFRNSGLTTALYTGSASNNDGTLTCADSVTITATYTDPQDNTDTRQDTATSTGEVIPSAPSNFNGSAQSSTSIKWTWTDNSNNETGFKLYDGSDNLIATISTANTTSYLESGLTKGTSYTRKLVSYNVAGNSSYSDPKTVVTPAEPTAPSSFTGVTSNSTSVIWTWVDNSNDETEWLLLNEDGTTLQIIPSRTITQTGGFIAYTETGLTKGTSYTRKVAAKNSDGTSSHSNTKEVTTPATKPDVFSLLSPSSGAFLDKDLPTFSFEKPSDTDDGINAITLTVGYLTFSIPKDAASSSNPISKTHYGSSFTAQYFNENDGNSDNDTISVTLKSGTLNGLPLSNTSYSWFVTAEDTGGNTRTTESRIFTVDTLSPTIDVIGITPSATLSKEGTYQISQTPTLSIPLVDNNPLKEVVISVSQASTTFGITSSYKEKETRTYPLSKTSETVSFTPRAEFERGKNYKVTVKVTDIAGNTATKDFLFVILTEAEQKQADVANLDPDSSTTQTIIDTIRSILPKNPLNIPDLQAQAFLRREKQAGNLTQFWSSSGEKTLSLFFQGQGLFERSLVYMINKAGRASDSLLAFFDAMNTTAQTTLVAATNNMQSFSLGITEKVIPDRALATIGSFLKNTFATTTANLATLQRVGQDTRVKQGLKNRQKISGWVEGILEPVRKSGDSVALKARGVYELLFDKEPTYISNLRITSVTPTTAVIEWNTNHLTKTTKVNYGPSISYGQEVISREITDTHRIELTDLKPGTTYYFEVMNQNGDYVFDAYYALTTPASEENSISTALIPQLASVKEDVEVYKEPVPEADVLMIIKPGATYRVLKSADGWISLLLPSGEEGWILTDKATLSDETKSTGAVRNPEAFASF